MPVRRSALAVPGSSEKVLETAPQGLVRLRALVEAVPPGGAPARVLDWTVVAVVA